MMSQSHCTLSTTRAPFVLALIIGFAWGCSASPGGSGNGGSGTFLKSLNEDYQ